MMKEVFAYIMLMDKSIILINFLDPSKLKLPYEGKVIKSLPNNFTLPSQILDGFEKIPANGYSDKREKYELCWVWFSEKKNEEAVELLINTYNKDKRLKKIHKQYILRKYHITKRNLCFKTKLGKYLKPTKTDYLYQYIKRFEPENRNAKRIENVLRRSFDIYTLQDLVNKPVPPIPFGKARGVGKKTLEIYIKIYYELYRIKRLKKSCVNIKTSK